MLSWICFPLYCIQRAKHSAAQDLPMCAPSSASSRSLNLQKQPLQSISWAPFSECKGRVNQVSGNFKRVQNSKVVSTCCNKKTETAKDTAVHVRNAAYRLSPHPDCNSFKATSKTSNSFRRDPPKSTHFELLSPRPPLGPWRPRRASA